jgi:hypothetical protein
MDHVNLRRVDRKRVRLACDRDESIVIHVSENSRPCIRSQQRGKWIGSRAALPAYNPPTVYTPKHIKAFTQYCPLWRTDGNFESTIQLSNQLVTAPIDATVTLSMADGTPYVLPVVHLNTAGVSTVSVNAALEHAPANLLSHLSTFGSASIAYTYDWQGVVYARMAILDIPRSLQYSYPFMFPMNTGMDMSKMATPMSTTVEGLIWRYSEETSAFLALSNTSSRDINVSLAVLDRDGNEEHRQQFTVAPMNTVLQTIEKPRKDDGLPYEERAGGVRVTFDADSDSLNLVGGIEDDKHGYSASMPLGTVAQQTGSATLKFASTGLMVGAQDPMMGFPAELRFTPFAYFRNMGNAAAQLTGRAYYNMNGQSQSAPLPALTIGPHQSRRLPLKGVIDSLNVNGSVTLAFSYTGPQASLLAETASVDRSGSYVFETIPRITGQSASKSSTGTPPMASTRCIPCGIQATTRKTCC